MTDTKTESESEPCCRPEHCPHQPEFQGHMVSWGGTSENGVEHLCCLCWDREPQAQTLAAWLETDDA